MRSNLLNKMPITTSIPIGRYGAYAEGTETLAKGDQANKNKKLC